MTCTKHFLNFHWERHSWHTRVSLAEDVPTEETSMWGRPVNRTEARCRKEDVCTACGAVRNLGDCICDTATAANCAVRLAWIDDPRRSATNGIPSPR